MSDLLAQRRHEEGAGGQFRADLLAPQGSDIEGDSGWLLVYLDVMTLLLVLFIVLLSFADPDPDPRPPQRLPSVLLPAPLAVPGVEPSATAPSVGAAEASDDGRAMEAPDIASDRVTVIRESDRVSLRIQDSLLFESGAASLTGEGLGLLDELVPVLRAHDGAISVEGHTDNRPIATDAFPSNWELSTARATEVVRYLDAAGVPAERMRAVGRADTDPVAPNTNAPGRAANRRVDLILHRESDP
ncbi:OmpA family protein [Aquisalimonas lutea]|uniref:OmpA/MotB family protein n=1 Tax=Aquisalimonas lutea TaxID=1327750 RepID=UPI0025B609E7|nr:OmpA family protein [Aquisalimonas lutea]MDN3516641.1 OmpA family protein [Aquisalimonas lutea]